MATTYALVFPAVADLDLKLKEIAAANRVNIDVVNSTYDANGNAAADYVYNAGSAKDTVTFQLRVNYNAKTDKTSCSLRVGTAIRETVSETGLVRDLPIEAVIAWNYKGKVCADTSAMLTLLQASAALVFKDLTGANGNPTTATVDSFDRRVISGLY